MSTEVKHRRGTSTEHKTFVGAIGEITLDTTDNTLISHNGVDPGGFRHIKELSAIALSLGVSASDVVYSTDTVTAIPSYIYDVTQQKIFSVPSGAQGETIVSVSGNTLTTNITTYTLRTDVTINISSVQELVLSQLPYVGVKVSTGATAWKVIATPTTRSIALTGGLFAIALNGIWATDAGATVDGVADDQPAIQYCVDLKASPVMLKEGEWLLGSEVIYYTGSTIRGVSKESVRVNHPSSPLGFKSESFDLVDTDTTRFEIGNMTVIGGWDNRVPTQNLVPQSAIWAKGYDYNIHDIDVEEYGDVGIYATSTDPVLLPQATEHIESYIQKIKAAKCYNGGVFLESPTDSFIKDVVVISLGDDDWGDTNYSATNYGIKTGVGGGSTIISDCHCYGYMEYTYNIGGGSTRLYDCIGEGGILGQVFIGVDGVQISRGRYFSGYDGGGASVRAVNQGVVVAAGVKDCKIETDIFFCNEGGVVFLGGGSGGHNIVNSVIFATDNGGAAAVPVQIVGVTHHTDTITLRYQQNAGNIVPSGIASQLTTNGAETSTFGTLTLGVSPTKAVDNNIFSVTRGGVGVFTINFTRPYANADYIVSSGAQSDHYLKVLLKNTNSMVFEMRTLPAYALGDGAVVDVKLTGLLT